MRWFWNAFSHENERQFLFARPCESWRCVCRRSSFKRWTKHNETYVNNICIYLSQWKLPCRKKTINENWFHFRNGCDDFGCAFSAHEMFFRCFELQKCYVHFPLCFASFHKFHQMTISYIFLFGEFSFCSGPMFILREEKKTNKLNSPTNWVRDRWNFKQITSVYIWWWTPATNTFKRKILHTKKKNMCSELGIQDLVHKPTEY